MVNTTPLITLPGVLLLTLAIIVFIFVKKFFSKKSEKGDIQEEVKTWKKVDELIEFKKHQYTQLFTFISGMIAIIVFALTLFFTNLDKTIASSGLLIAIILVILVGGMLIWFMVILLRALDKSNKNLEFLLRKKNKSLEYFYDKNLSNVNEKYASCDLKEIDKKLDVLLKNKEDQEEKFRLFPKKDWSLKGIAKSFGIKEAVLKQKSPSCGCGKIFDGSFSDKLIRGNGVTTQLLKDNGIKVISEEDL